MLKIVACLLALMCFGVAMERYFPDGPNTVRCDIRRC